MRVATGSTAGRGTVLAALAVLACAAGCHPAGPKTFPVRGQVTLPGADVGLLAGSLVEVVLEDDPTVRASGAIGPDGRFALQTLDQGVVRAGVRAGRYQARIILGDDDREAFRKASQALDPRFLHWQASGLTVQVPAGGDVVLKLARR